MGWLVHTVVGGGLVLLVACAVMRFVRAPARRQRLGEWALLAALLLSVLSLGPSWIAIPLPSAQSTSLPTDEPASNASSPQALPQAPEAGWPDGLVFLPPEALDAAQDPPIGPQPAEQMEPRMEAKTAAASPTQSLSPGQLWNWIGIVSFGVYGIGALVLLGRWLVGQIGLRRILWGAEPAPLVVRRVFEELAGGSRTTRLLVSKRVQVPFSCGLVRPTVVLPTAFALSAERAELRWVLAHELAHLERRDAWGSLLFNVGQVAYFYLPWFWWLGRQVRLCQEYLADAAAARPEGPIPYAQFLVGWTKAPAPPLGCTGVSGFCSDLFRRIAMLLHNSAPLERRCPRYWSLLAGCGLFSLAVMLSGLGLDAAAAPAPSKNELKKEEPKQAEPKKAEPKPDKDAVNPFPQFEEILKHLPQGLDPDQLKTIQQQLEQQRKEMEKAFRGFHGQIQVGPGALGLRGHMPEPRLGVRVMKPSATLADQLDLPRDQGLVIEEVSPNSPAEKAGLKPHDILLEFNGKAVPSNVEELVKQLGQIKSGTAVEAIVLRKGKKETLKGIKLVEDGAAAANPNLGFFPPAKALTLKGFVPGAANLDLGNFGLGNMVGLGGVANGVLTTTFRGNDRFTTRHQEGSLVITITGKVADGKAAATEIRVQDGAESHRYESLDKVPDRYRDKVKNLIEMSEKSGVKVEIK
jgi:beta-lactamase regulating signal transducer with metallopeptidase domain